MMPLVILPAAEVTVAVATAVAVRVAVAKAEEATAADHIFSVHNQKPYTWLRRFRWAGPRHITRTRRSSLLGKMPL